MSNHVFIATSLDGYIADAAGSVDWLNALSAQHMNDNLDNGEDVFGNFMHNIDAILMGRNTFEVVKTFEQWVYTKPVIVMSSRLQSLEPTYAGKASISAEDIEILLPKLHAQGLHRLYIDGGKLIQSFLQKNLIDSMTITRIPVLLGAGIPLFGMMPQMMFFKHVQNKVLSGGFVMDTYVPSTI